MKVKVLGSGSKGNCTYVETKDTKILIDFGLSSMYVVNELNKIEVDPRSIDMILITHTHSDHINGLKVFCKKYKTKVYIPKELLLELDYLNNLIVYDNDIYHLATIINSINTSHDVSKSKGFIIKEETKGLVYITDTGYINNKYYDKLKNKDIYIIESNHDVEMLMNGNYPYYLKQRILGDKGHLSNKDCAYNLSKMVGYSTKCVVLAHLSEENNSEELAYQTVKETLFDKKVIVAKQKESTEMITV